MLFKKFSIVLLPLLIFVECTKNTETTKPTSTNINSNKPIIDSSINHDNKPDSTIDFGSLELNKKAITLIDTLVNQNKGNFSYFIKPLNSDSYAQINLDSLSKLINNGYEYKSLIVTWNYNGKILRAKESPFSQSGNFTIDYDYYFDNDGLTIYFHKYTGFFNCLLNDDVSKEHKHFYYDESFAVIETDSSFINLQDSTKKMSDCMNAYVYPYNVSKSLKQLLDVNKITTHNTLYNVMPTAVVKSVSTSLFGKRQICDLT